MVAGGASMSVFPGKRLFLQELQPASHRYIWCVVSSSGALALGNEAKQKDQVPGGAIPCGIGHSPITSCQTLHLPKPEVQNAGRDSVFHGNPDQTMLFQFDFRL